MVPTAMIDAGCTAHARLLAAVAGLTDDQARRPSRLSGWTVGHVLTHLARNADSHTGLLEAAARGEVGRQYPGGTEQRARDIEIGAPRPAGELVADVAESAARLEAAWHAASRVVWTSGRADSGLGPYPVAELPFRRVREVELHHLDLGLGDDPAAWSAVYVDAELDHSLAELGERLGPDTVLVLQVADRGRTITVGSGAERREVSAPAHTLVAWLTGRGRHPSWPALAPWQREQRRRA